MARRHAGKRPGDVRRETDRPLAGEAVEMRRLELGAAVATQHVAVEAVEQQHDDIARPTARPCTTVYRRDTSGRTATGSWYGRSASTEPRMPSPNSGTTPGVRRAHPRNAAPAFVTLRGLEPRQREESPMRSLLRFGAFGCALAMASVPLAIGGGSSIAGAASSPATVAASNWSTMANTAHDAGRRFADRCRVLRDLCVLRRGHGRLPDEHHSAARIPVRPTGLRRALERDDVVADDLADGVRRHRGHARQRLVRRPRRSASPLAMRPCRARVRSSWSSGTDPPGPR